jgi:hypothetical protein
MKLIVIAAFILIFWSGYVSSISFMEAWLKFKAPGITLPLGLGIGKMVFSALNKVEWVLLVVYILLNIFYFNSLKFLLNNHLLQVIIVILLLQTLWLLPGLIQRSELIISGKQPDASNIHIYYVVMEIIKVVLLVALALKQGFKAIPCTPCQQ